LEKVEVDRDGQHTQKQQIWILVTLCLLIWWFWLALKKPLQV